MERSAIRLVLAGGHYVPRHIVELAAVRRGKTSMAASNADPSSLSARQLDVLAALAMGKSNKEIARDFDVSPATVRAHASAIHMALGAANRTDAVMRARDMGLV